MATRLACSAILVLAGLTTQAIAQTLTPPPGATYGQPLPVPPMRPLYYSPFTNYDLIYGYSRGALTAPQPIGHEHIPLGPNGYIYQPVYATPPQAPATAAQSAQRQLGAAPTNKPQAAPSILRRFNDAPPPAPESVSQQPPVQPQQAQPRPPVRREF